MHPILVKPIDWLVIRMAAACLPQTAGLRANTEAAGQLMAEADFFCGGAGVPADFQFLSETDFRFASPIATPWEENNIVHGRLFPCARDWEFKPAVILVHGWNDVFGYRFRSPWLAGRLRRAGINTAILELPYHMRRRPHRPDAVRNFISEDLLRTVEATRQAVADVRSLKNWLQAQGVPRVGLCGFSLGAWISGLIVCHDPGVHFSVLTTPVVDMERVVGELAFCEPIRRSLSRQPISFDRLNLALHRPMIPKEHILLIEGRYDLFAPPETIEEVWDRWGRPEIWRLRHGHISALMSLPVLNRTVKWIGAVAHR